MQSDDIIHAGFNANFGDHLIVSLTLKTWFFSPYYDCTIVTYATNNIYNIKIHVYSFRCYLILIDYSPASITDTVAMQLIEQS